LGITCRFVLKVVRWAGRWGLKIFLFTIPVWLVALFLLWRELRGSNWQAHFLARVAGEATFSLQDGATNNSWFPTHGPYDERLGYTREASIIQTLIHSGYEIIKQARQSPRFLELANMGIYPPFREKTRAGITILDRVNTTIYSAYRPTRIYENFDMLPPIVVNSLLYIENREILDQSYPKKNPAIEWDRFGKAIFEKIKQIIHPDINAPGGSTIATQLQKYRHSKEGRTSGIRDKLLQMASASIHAYMYGEETLPTRKLIVLQYINSIPLAALPGYGEVNGLGDGLWAWYGLDFDEINQRLRSISRNDSADTVRAYAESYKQMLSLFIAHRRPSFFLLTGLDELNSLTNTYLDLLAHEDVISDELCKQAKEVKLTLRRAAPKAAPISFVQLKAANAIRTRLLNLMDYPQLYDLDQVDLTVKSTMDNGVNEAVTDVLRQIKDEESVKKFGLSGARNLARGDPSKVIYSLTLYERVGEMNLLRVQTDNFNKPFSINEGTRLDLGSTAKLRTLVTYLSAVGDLYDRYSIMKPAQLKAEMADDLDPISEFVAQTIARQPGVSLTAVLDMAMLRQYSASPGETFFTGSGLHTFENFKHEDDGKMPTVQEALTHSINLPFIRIMRDVVRYYTHNLGVDLKSVKRDRKNQTRMHFLKKFADQEGSQFMRQFYQKYRNQNASEVLTALVKNTRASAKHAAAMYRYVRPNGTVEQMAEFLAANLKTTNLSLDLVEKWYEEFAPGKFSLNDHGYVARIHPLELWLVKYLQDHPGVSIDKALEDSAEERQHVYQWLFNTPHQRAQDIRIRTLVEIEAFLQIHKQWRKVGYPFNSMVPSLASAIGSSGDRPAALAELVGIILNDGVRYPLVRLEELHFAADTPYEVILRRSRENQGERVLKSEVAQMVKRAMVKVVENGTARRVYQTFVRSDGKAYTIGGKTGTGDQRYETFGPGGNLISSRVVNRTATFAFYIGDRFFGVISAHVPGAEAAKFDFTSALAAELLKVLSKSLVPLIESAGTGLSPIPDAPPAPVLPTAKATTAAETATKTTPEKTPVAVPSSSTPKAQTSPAPTKPAAKKRMTPLPLVLPPM